MPDYLTPGYRNTDEGRPVWKRPAFLIIAALIVLAVVGAAYFLNGEETDRSSGSGNSDGGHTTDERATFSRIESLSNHGRTPGQVRHRVSQPRRGRTDIGGRSSTWTRPTRGSKYGRVVCLLCTG